MTPRQEQKVRKIANLTFNRYISEQECYMAIINLIDEIRCSGIIDIDYEDIKG